MKTLFIQGLALLFVAASGLAAAHEDAGQGLPNLIKANERFAGKLLVHVHSGADNRNVLLSPISLTIMFAALQSSMEYGPARKEIGDAFGWGEYPHLGIPARMLLAAFEKPAQVTPQSKKTVLYQRRPEAAWITNTLLYRGSSTLSEQFVTDAHQYFGVSFKSTGTARPTTDLQIAGKSPRSLPTISAKNDILISSGSHLQTAWSGNTFSMSEPYKARFMTASGEPKQVEMLDSERGSYLHAKNETFEAVILPCNNSYMLAVLPAPGRSLQDVEHLIAESPGSIDAVLKREIGMVIMPTFHFQFHANLRQDMEALGIRTVFEDLGPLIKIPNSHLTEIAQETDIQVDKQGIQANADTVAGAIYGGITGAANAFRMDLNRPFVFLIRDQASNALLFIGVVVDPTQN